MTSPPLTPEQERRIRQLVREEVAAIQAEASQRVAEVVREAMRTRPGPKRQVNGHG